MLSVVCLVYWTMMYVDKNLIDDTPYKGFFDPDFILTIDLHGVSLFLLIVDSAINPDYFKLSYKVFFFVDLALLITYSTIQYACLQVTGVYVYGFLQAFSLKQLFCMYSCLFVISYTVGMLSSNLMVLKPKEKKS